MTPNDTNKTNSEVKFSAEESEDKFEKNGSDKEVAETVVQGDNILETVGLDEAVEAVGEAKEASSKAKEQKGGVAAGAKTSTAADHTLLKEKLLKNLPSEEVMKSQVTREINKEVKHLHKEVLKLLRSSENNFYEANNLMAKIRELKSILFSLMRIPFENLKALWLRFVHGIM